MIVQLGNSIAKTVVSGHNFKNDCPDRVHNAANNGRNMGEIDAITKSGHSAKDVDKHGINDVSGHVSGHDEIQISSKGHFIGQTVLYSDSTIDDNRDKGHNKGQSNLYNANRKGESDDKGHKFECGCPDNNKREYLYITDNQEVDANRDIIVNESGHLSGHECPDNTKSKGINGQSGQSELGDMDSVRYNGADGDDIKQDIGHFIGHVR
jgi:hypothetical protein